MLSITFVRPDFSKIESFTLKNIVMSSNFELCYENKTRTRKIYLADILYILYKKNAKFKRLSL